MSEPVKIAALAIWRTRDSRFPPRVQRPKPDAFDEVSGATALVIEEAAAVFADLDAAGFAIVPKEPPPDVLKSGGWGFSPGDMESVWRFVLNAAPKVTP